MGRSQNLIDRASATFFNGIGSWSIVTPDPDNEGQFLNVPQTSIAIERNDVFPPRFSTLRITPPNDDDPVILRYSNVFVDKSFANDSVQFHCRVKVAVGSIVRVILKNSNYENVEADTGTGFNRWDICRSLKFTVPDIGEDIRVSVEVVITGHLGNDIYFAVPFMFLSDNLFRDLYVLETFRYLPSVIRDAEQQHESVYGLPDFPLTRFLELPGNFAGDVVSDYYAFQYLSESQGKNPDDVNTLSALVDPLAAKPEFLPWLSQFVGVYLDNPTTGKTPWQNIPPEWNPVEQDIDPLANPTYTPTILSRSSNVVTATIGSHVVQAGKSITITGTDAVGYSFDGTYEIVSVTGTTISWNQINPDNPDFEFPDESATVMGTITLLDTEWEELENYNPAIIGLVDYLRWQAKYAYNGLNAGTYDAVVNSVKRALTGTKKVTVEYFYDNNPWQIRIRTKTSESPDGETEDQPPADGVKSFTIDTYIKRAKPAGFKIIHECTQTGE